LISCRDALVDHAIRLRVVYLSVLPQPTVSIGIIDSTSCGVVVLLASPPKLPGYLGIVEFSSTLSMQLPEVAWWYRLVRRGTKRHAG